MPVAAVVEANVQDSDVAIEHERKALVEAEPQLPSGTPDEEQARGDHAQEDEESDRSKLRRDDGVDRQQVDALMRLYSRRLVHEDGNDFTAVRQWLDRPKLPEEKAVMAGSVAVPVDHSQHTANEEESADARTDNVAGVAKHEHRVAVRQGGIFRGQVLVEVTTNEFDEVVDTQLIPDGRGVLVLADGSVRYGVWKQGKQVGFGVLQSPWLLYEGQWSDDEPSGYGAGLLLSDFEFIGAWAHGKPSGLGQLRKGSQMVSSQALSPPERGWISKRVCVQAVSQESPIPTKIRVSAAFSDQPQRGLYIACMRLEFCRVRFLQRAICRWQSYVCERAVCLGQQSRLIAMIAWADANSAEHQALGEQAQQELEHRRQEDAAIIAEVNNARTKHARMQRTKQFQTFRWEDAQEQLNLTRGLVAKEQANVVLMEERLTKIKELLVEAKVAQEDCQTTSRKVLVLKRQIENICVKINHQRHEIHQRQLRQERERLQLKTPDTTRLTTPATPVTAPTTAGRGLWANGSGLDALGSDRQEANHPFVCDVPGCTCGIPRDVFMRVASLLNGD